jgi:hypothetical protein
MEKNKPIIDIEEIIFNLESNSNGWESSYMYEEVKKGIKIALSQSLNHILNKVAEEATIKSEGDWDSAGEYYEYGVVDKESILKLKEVLKQDLGI